MLQAVRDSLGNKVSTCTHYMLRGVMMSTSVSNDVFLIMLGVPGVK